MLAPCPAARYYGPYSVDDRDQGPVSVNVGGALQAVVDKLNSLEVIVANLDARISGYVDLESTVTRHETFLQTWHTFLGTC